MPVSHPQASRALDDTDRKRSADVLIRSSRRFEELQLAIKHPPLDLAVALGRVTNGLRFSLYEHHDRIFVGIGAVWTVEVDCVGRVFCNGRLDRHSPNIAQALASASAAIPFDDWRAYGRACFEFADLVHGIDLRYQDGPLLALAVPSTEIILQDNSLLVRSFDGRNLLQLADLIRKLDDLPHLIPASSPVIAPECQRTRSRYLASVTAAIDEMQKGIYDKIVLSRAVTVPADIDLPLSFHAGRSRNTPARSFLLRDGLHEAYGFSPETLIEVDERRQVSTQPLAGTRALDGPDDQDRILRDELVRDAKEIAEHAVSVKMSMQDMRSLCEPESIGVSEFMEVCHRGNVQHLASRVRGTLMENSGPWDALLQLFPAATVSGIPKPAALAAIRRLETRARGLYGGCVFMMEARGAMDAAVVIRSVFRDEDGCRLQAGAGILPLSSPARELEETSEKLAGVARYLRASQ